jgi:hypothetical protein
MGLAARSWKIAVVIRCFNERATTERLIDAALAAQCSALDVIVLDSCGSVAMSSDGDE